MSGIYGIFRKDGAPVSPETMAAIRTPIRFWGRDGGDEWRADCVGLGHLMLHTTPESLHERQPISHPHRPKLVITADARIDNRTWLCDVLSIPREQHATIGDSLLILLAYERWGKECVNSLIGDFAFAIWDGERRTLFCARDVMGVRPFLYYDSDQFFVFASDIRGLLVCPGVPTRLHEELIAAYLQFYTFVPEKRLSFYEGIVKIPPAHHLTVSSHRTHLSQYWIPEDAPKVRLASDEAYAEQAKMLLQEAVACRVRSAFPVGSHVSGGLDSSIVAMLAARQLPTANQPLYGYTRTPLNDTIALQPADERTKIEQICRQAGIPCRYTTLTVENSIAQQMRDFTQEPYTEMLEEQHLQRMAAEDGVRVLLSGYGGDEVVSYRDNITFRVGLAWQGQWLTLHRHISGSLARRQDGANGIRHVKRYLGTLYYGVWRPLFTDLSRSQTHQKWRFPSTYIQADFAQRHQEAVIEMLPPAKQRRRGIRAEQCWWLHLGYLTNRMEHWATAGAEQGFVYRYPLLDRRLLEFCLGIPAEQFCRDGQDRLLLRHVMRDMMPADFLQSSFKPDPVRLEGMYNVTARLQAELLSRVLTRNPDHPAAAWVDIPHLQRAIAAIPPSGIDLEALGKIHALSTLYINLKSATL